MRLGMVGVGRIGVLHAETLRDLPDVDAITIADADSVRAEQAAEKLGVSAAADVDELFASRPDGVVIAAATPAHAGLVRQALQAGVPVFCEKPLAANVEETKEILAAVASSGVPLQMGFQRRFDPGYLAARERLRDGELGWLHSIWACTLDPAPPHASYIPTSGGLYRDCGVHDIDVIRWVTGREVIEVYATGANKGAEFFVEAGDIDTGHALLTLDDGTVAAIAASRYNGAGYDVRMELHGSQGSAVVGLDDQVPLRSAEPGTDWPPGQPYANFAARFHAAYAAELAAFVDVAAGRIESPCPGSDALEALFVADACELSRREGRRVEVAEVRR